MSKLNSSTTDELRRTSPRPLSWPAPGPALQPQLQPSIVMFIVVYRLSRGRRPGTYLDIYNSPLHPVMQTSLDNAQYIGIYHEGSLFSVLCIYQLGIIPATMRRQWLYLFTQKLSVIVSSKDNRIGHEILKLIFSFNYI